MATEKTNWGSHYQTYKLFPTQPHLATLLRDARQIKIIDLSPGRCHIEFNEAVRDKLTAFTMARTI